MRNIKTNEEKLRLLRQMQMLHKILVLKNSDSFKHLYVNRNKAIYLANRLQDEVISNIIAEKIYGNQTKINYIDSRSVEIISELLNNERRRTFRGESKIIDSTVNKYVNQYSEFLSNRIKTESINLKSKIEKEIKRDYYKNLSETEWEEKLKIKFGNTGKKKINTIIRDAMHSQDCNISFLTALAKGYEYKIWRNGNLKGKTRPWHISKHITPVRIDEYFDIYGSYHAQAMYPGDLNSGSENVAGCRCWLTYTNERPMELITSQRIFKIPDNSYLNSKKSREDSNPQKITTSKSSTNIKTKIQNIGPNIKSKLKIHNVETKNVKINQNKKNSNKSSKTRIPRLHRQKPKKKNTIRNKLQEIKEKRKLNQYISKFGKNIKVYKYKKVCIILQNNPNYISVPTIEKLYDSLPSILTKYVEEIVIKNETMMIGGVDVLGYVEGRNKYCNVLRSNSSLNEYKNTIVHELVHILDNNKGIFKFKISNSKKWKNACKKDEAVNFVIDPWTGRKISNNYVSKYSREVYFDSKYTQKIKQSEDLAESIMRYLDPDDTEFVKKFPNRAEFIKELLGVEPGEIQIKQRR